MSTEIALPVTVPVFQPYIFDAARGCLYAGPHRLVNADEALKIVFQEPEIEAFRFGEVSRLVYEKRNFDTLPVYRTEMHYVGAMHSFDQVGAVVTDIDRRRRLVEQARAKEYSDKAPRITHFVLTRGDQLFALRGGDVVHDMHDLGISEVVGAPMREPERLRISGHNHPGGSGLRVVGGTGFGRFDPAPGR